MSFIRRLMEIKEEQLNMEKQRTYEILQINNRLIQINHRLIEILELMKLHYQLKRGAKNGKNTNRKHR